MRNLGAEDGLPSAALGLFFYGETTDVQLGGDQAMSNDDEKIIRMVRKGALKFRRGKKKEMLDYALEYAKKGWPVFPCGINKKPLITDRPNKASNDPEQIKTWWSRNPEASIGLVCGEEAGVWVLDVDLKSGGIDSLAKLQEEHGEMPETLIQKTGGGGTHYFWNWNGKEIRNSASKVAPGIDVRGKGGYVVLPPSGHPSGGMYKWENDAEIAEAPDWLAELASKKIPDPSEGRETGKSSKYGEAALAKELMKLSSASEGSRNETLNKCAHALGQLIAGGELNGLQAESALFGTAISIGLEEKEARNTIRSGIKAGETQPEFCNWLYRVDLMIVIFCASTVLLMCVGCGIRRGISGVPEMDTVRPERSFYSSR